MFSYSYNIQCIVTKVALCLGFFLGGGSVTFVYGEVLKLIGFNIETGTTFVK